MRTKNQHIHGAKTAIFAAGEDTKAAKKLSALTGKSVTQQRVAGWKKNGVPDTWVIPLEKISGISRHLIRPDIYPEDGK